MFPPPYLPQHPPLPPCVGTCPIASGLTPILPVAFGKESGGKESGDRRKESKGIGRAKPDFSIRVRGMLLKFEV